MKLERDVAQGIHRIEDSHVNWYLVEGEGGLTVVDAGVRASWSSLHRVLDELRRPASDLKALVLTHAHFDHVGFAERARRELGLPVYVHHMDATLARKPMQYTHERPRWRYLLTRPRALPIVAGLAAGGALWPPGVQKVERFANRERLPVPGSPEVVPTPGHTLGHCALAFADRDAVLAGDALVMIDPYTGAAGPRIVAGAATADSEWALRSLEALAATGARTVLTGHGEPWHGGAAEAVALARTAGPS